MSSRLLSQVFPAPSLDYISNVIAVFLFRIYQEVHQRGHVVDVADMLNGAVNMVILAGWEAS